jgi:hypothetical protein
MVHALGEIHRVLAPRGILVDARPDSRVPAYAERQRGRTFERFGVVETTKLEMTNDLAADAAIERVVHDALFKSMRRGRFWHRVPFDNLAALRRYLWEHQRFVRRAKWLVDQPTLKRLANDRFVIRRGVRYEVFERRESG